MSKLYWCYVGLFFSVLLFAPGKAGGQESNPPVRPDFSGKWLLESRFEEGLGKVSLPSSTEIRLEISHHDPALTILQLGKTTARTDTAKLVYFTDGRGEKNPGPGLVTSLGGSAKVEVKSDTKWKKKKLVVRGTFRLRLGAGRSNEVTQIEEWEMTADGKTLTQVTTKRFEDQGVDIQSGSRMPPIIIATRPLRSKRIYRRIE